jgi:hypothetical protein
VCEREKSSHELAVDAEVLFASISHQRQKPNHDALRKLTSRLSHVAKWRPLSCSMERKFEDCLRVPFFYGELDKKNWNDTSSTDYTISLEYEYQPLRPAGGETRLIELFSSPKKFTEVRCRIYHTELDSNPTYDGVSYFWGDREISLIRINGLLLEAPASLVADLRNLRTNEINGSTGSRILFVDAICFDWTHPEKAEHPTRVGLTPRIFKQAQQVAIGLGDRDEADASAIEFVRRVASMSASDAELPEILRQWSGNDHERWADCMGVSILRLFQRPWWRRLWYVCQVPATALDAKINR